MKGSKIIGYLLLLLGIAIIFWSLYSSYNIFTAKIKAPEIFEIPKKEKALPAARPEFQLEKIISEQLKELIPADTITKILNLIAWSIFMGILIFGGSQIANLGIKLIKA